VPRACVLEGLIFVCLGDAPPPPECEAAFAELAEIPRPHGLGDAKIATSILWTVTRTGSSSSRTSASATTAARRIPNTAR
jgi:hypothetical protein